MVSDYDAIKSKYQEKPWEPTVDNSKDSQKKAGEDYTAVYGGTVNTGSDSDSDSSSGSTPKDSPIPTLSSSYTAAPSFIPVSPPPSSSKPFATSTSVENGAFSVNLAALRSAEQSCLDSTAATISELEILKNEVSKANEPNFFGQEVGQETSTPTTNGSGSSTVEQGYSHHWLPGDTDQSSKDYAASIIPAMHTMLAQIGGVVEAMGQFNALLNNAGQTYAVMDSNAAFTDTSTMSDSTAAQDWKKEVEEAKEAKAASELKPTTPVTGPPQTPITASS
ncbi:hypothetical protein [Actinacidiphila yeochonensis]|uniref:hypothetical protein n=1 Tax=Actinacidiphila yeochonensis TaxID=89050 RepID=UPI000560D0AD|nr:hypothetical protein [Actinacidiphila yeochonensis]